MFAIRTSKPGKGNKHFIRTANGGYNTCIKGKPTDSECNVLSNCVGYAQGRFNEIYAELTGYKGNKYNTLNCNAENFIERAKAAGLQVGQTPKPGAIMCWQKGGLGSSDGAGHVAVVEKVISNSQVYTSESGYNSKAFWNSTRSNSNGRWGSSSAYSFRGFIYNPAVKEEEKNPYTEPTTTVKKGNKGEGVKWVQWYLMKKGYDCGCNQPDGSCGPKTDSAIRKFQKDKGLEVDGKVGAKTRAALKS